MAKTKISIYDIAKLAGVSACTVSYALNGRGRVSEKTRNKVLEIAKRQGYVANYTAKSLRERRTRTVGIVTPDVSNDFFSTIVMDAESQLAKQGYTAYICDSLNESDCEIRYLRSLTERQADGILFIGGSNPIVDERVGTDICAVCIDRHHVRAREQLVIVGNDVRAMFYDATATLLGHGCSRVALLSVSAHDEGLEGLPRFDGYRDALAEHGIALDERLVVDGPHRDKSYVEAERLVGNFLDDGGQLDGIVANGDRLALGATKALKARGLMPGKDVLVIGTDDSLYSKFAEPAISTIDRGTQTMAAEGVRALLTMMGGREPERRTVVVPHRVVERASTLG